MVFVSTLYVRSQPNLVYLVDFVFYKLKDERKVKIQMFIQQSKESRKFDEKNLDF